MVLAGRLHPAGGELWKISALHDFPGGGNLDSENADTRQIKYLFNHNTSREHIRNHHSHKRNHRDQRVSQQSALHDFPGGGNLDSENCNDR